MKAVILAGGFGTRISEETHLKPKPMIEIGGMPILWHIMKHYSAYGFDEFVVALGYKGEYIKRYFVDFLSLAGSLTVDLEQASVTRMGDPCENWKVHLIDTGLSTNTGGRVRRLADLIGKESFMLTYGDGVCNVDLKGLLKCHSRSNALATVTAVRPPARFGGLDLNGDLVKEFQEKPQMGEGWINGGFMVLEPEVLDMLYGDDSNLERNALEPLAEQGKLAGYQHPGFWQCMDTLRDKRLLESLWNQPDPPWKTW